MKFILLVEGYTEEKVVPGFLKRWLNPRLAQPVEIQPIRFDGYTDFLKRAKLKVHLHMQSPRAPEIVAAIGLIDLYGPNIFPDDLRSVEKRYRWGAQYVEELVEHPKFKMFFSVHEVEAWLLSQPEILPVAVQRALPRSVERPEKVNFHCPPGKLLDRLYREFRHVHYKKVTYGSRLFARLDPDAARLRCPYLREMMDQMLTMAYEAVGGIGAKADAELIDL
jgi:hypothetical protein